MRVLRLVDLHRGRDCIAITCAIDDLRFHTTIWYAGVDLDALARAHGAERVDRLAFTAALFQLDALVSLRPDAIALGRWARWLTPRLAALWHAVVAGVWAQWRYEHDLPDYAPRFVEAPAAAPAPVPATATAPAAGGPLLAMCGGGKDSLVACKLLERGGLPFATLGYAHSIYGDAAAQHALIERVAAATARVRGERQWVTDDFLGSPVVELRGPSLGVRALTAAETPASVFAAVPLALARGYRAIVVAHERGANTPNLIWRGAPVNHQWGKSLAAERLLDDYLRSELAPGLRYFSVLAPVHDEVIFELLARDAELAARTHSCNVGKPWCGACAKCAYVWLQMAAHLPPAVVAATFAGAGDIGERPDNARWWRELFGLAPHTPFECTGGVAEARLALELARRRGAIGPRLAAIAGELPAFDVATAARELVTVGDDHAMPDDVAAAVMPQLRDAANAAAARLGV
jgi:hypothetical protein